MHYDGEKLRFFCKTFSSAFKFRAKYLTKEGSIHYKKVMDLVVYLLAGLNAVLFYFVILEKVMDLVVYLLAGLNAVLF